MDMSLSPFNAQSCQRLDWSNLPHSAKALAAELTARVSELAAVIGSDMQGEYETNRDLATDFQIIEVKGKTCIEFGTIVLQCLDDIANERVTPHLFSTPMTEAKLSEVHLKRVAIESAAKALAPLMSPYDIELLEDFSDVSKKWHAQRSIETTLHRLQHDDVTKEERQQLHTDFDLYYERGGRIDMGDCEKEMTRQIVENILEKRDWAFLQAMKERPWFTPYFVNQAVMDIWATIRRESSS